MLIILSLFVGLSLASVMMPSDIHDLDQVHSTFSLFEKEFNRTFETLQERSHRLTVFADNLKQIKKLNANRGKGSAYFGIGPFADLTNKEFRQQMLLSNPIKPSKKALPKHVQANEKTLKNAVNAVPNKMDWRDKHVVTPVKNQGQCGSCWAFSVTENIESVWLVAGKGNVSSLRLAPQQLVDCSDLNLGCNGGNPPFAYESIIAEGGLETEREYPYRAADGTCQLKNGVASPGSVKISSWSLASGFFNEHAMVQALVDTAPLSVCVDASNWQHYQGGVMDHDQCAEWTWLDHCVQLVGYDKTAPKPFYKVRNSWSERWGLDGYIHLQMWQATCGISFEATTSVL